MDFTPVWANLTFSYNVTVQTIRIWITDDNEEEEAEYFLVVVRSDDPRCIAGRPANITIAMSGESSKTSASIYSMYLYNAGNYDCTDDQKFQLHTTAYVIIYGLFQTLPRDRSTTPPIMHRTSSLCTPTSY